MKKPTPMDDENSFAGLVTRLGVAGAGFIDLRRDVERMNNKLVDIGKTIANLNKVRTDIHNFFDKPIPFSIQVEGVEKLGLDLDTIGDAGFADRISRLATMNKDPLDFMIALARLSMKMKSAVDSFLSKKEKMEESLKLETNDILRSLYERKLETVENTLKTLTKRTSRLFAKYEEARLFILDTMIRLDEQFDNALSDRHELYKAFNECVAKSCGRANDRLRRMENFLEKRNYCKPKKGAKNDNGKH